MPRANASRRSVRPMRRMAGGASASLGTTWSWALAMAGLLHGGPVAAGPLGYCLPGLAGRVHVSSSGARGACRVHLGARRGRNGGGGAIRTGAVAVAAGAGPGGVGAGAAAAEPGAGPGKEAAVALGRPTDAGDPGGRHRPGAAAPGTGRGRFPACGDRLGADEVRRRLVWNRTCVAAAEPDR